MKNYLLKGKILVSFVIILFLMLSSCNKTTPGHCSDGYVDCDASTGILSEDECDCQCREGWIGYNCQTFIESLSAANYRMEIKSDEDINGTYETTIATDVLVTITKHEVFKELDFYNYPFGPESGRNEFIDKVAYDETQSNIIISSSITDELYLGEIIVSDSKYETSENQGKLEIWGTSPTSETNYHYVFLRKYGQ